MLLGDCPSGHPLKSGKTVVLELKSGEKIFSIAEICRVSCQGGGGGGEELVGESPVRQANVDYWIDWGCGQLKVSGCGFQC